MKRMFLIYKTCMKANIASAITYRVNFILNSLIMLIGNVLFPLVTVFIYNSNASFEGWTFKEALLIQSVFILSTACAGIFQRNHVEYDVPCSGRNAGSGIN